MKRLAIKKEHYLTDYQNRNDSQNRIKDKQGVACKVGQATFNMVSTNNLIILLRGFIKKVC